MNELQITEYKDIRVLTTQQIAEAYGTNSDIISRNFSNNKDRYKEGKHYICLKGKELKDAKANGKIYGLPQNANKFYLWTEKGAFLHAKSLGTDEAWEVYERLVDFYFNRKKPLTAIEQLQLTQQAVLEVKEQIDNVNKDLQDFKQDLPLLAIECERITRAVKIKGVDVLGGKQSEAYRDNSLRHKVYSDIYGEIKRQFGVNSYKALKRNQCEKAVEVIGEYQPPMIIAEEIADTNAQMNLRDAV